MDKQDEEIPTVPKIKVRQKYWEYQLEYPKKFGDKLIETIKFRSPTMGNLNQLGDGARVGDLMRVAAATCCDALSPRFFKELDPVDGFAIAERITDFLPSGQ